MPKIEVTWGVEDGYVGNRHHYSTYDTENDMSDDEWDELTDDEKKVYVEEFIQNEFIEKIHWYANYNIE